MSGKWSVGQWVVHRKYGLGIITAIEQAENGPAGRIAFGAGPERRIVLDRKYLRDADEGLASGAAVIIDPVPADDDYGHGGHWKIFFDEVKTAVLRLPSFFERATPACWEALGKLPGMWPFCEKDQRNGMVARSLDNDAPFDVTLFAPARTLEGPPPRLAKMRRRSSGSLATGLATDRASAGWPCILDGSKMAM